MNLKSFSIIGLSLLLSASETMPAELSDQQRLAVVNYGENYLYTIYVNQEPLDYGHNPSSLEWTGYPIIVGSNEVTFIAHPLTESAGPINCVITAGDLRKQMV